MGCGLFVNMGPKAFKERLRKNNSILNDRELEKSFKGKISGKPKVEF